MIAAQASSKAKIWARLRMRTPSASNDPPKYSPTTAPIMARTLATFSAVKTYGRAFGIRTRRKIWSWPAP